MTEDSTSGFGAASGQQALWIIAQALRSRDAAGARDTMTFAAAAPMAEHLIKALDDSAGVIGEWMALRNRGNWWMFATDTEALTTPGVLGDLVVMMQLADADVLCTSLGMPAPDPGRTLARVVGADVPRLLITALDVVDPPPPG